MFSQQPHIIRRQVLNVHGTGDTDGMRLQQETEQLYRAHILPGLEKLLDRYDTGDTVITLDKLSVSLKDVRPDNINSALAQQILDEVEKLLRQSVQQAMGKEASWHKPEERFLQSWIHYLQHGYFPWWANVTDNQSWQEYLDNFLQDVPAQALALLRPYLNNANAIARLVAQLNDTSFWPFFRKLTGWNTDLLRSLAEDEVILADVLSAFIPQKTSKYKFRELLLSVAGQAYTQHLLTGFFAGRLVTWLHTLPPEGLHELKKAPLQTAEVKNMLDKYVDEITDMPEQKTGTDIIEDLNTEDGIYINNAGIVLIAPYLPSFFSRADLVRDNIITDPRRAVGLLQYIIAGDEAYAEFEMVLPKLLCGVEPEIAVADGYLLTIEEKELVHEMLLAVISHWEALKNTTVDGLRSGFLQREGKLYYNNNTWRLQVQEQPYDMLLDYLPWSISMIRLPWMPYLLHVDWK